MTNFGARVSKILRLSVLGSITLVILIFAIANRLPVEVSLFPFPLVMQVPIFMLVFAIFLSGLVVGAGLSLAASARIKRELRSSSQQNEVLRNEIITLKAESAANSSGIPAISQSKAA